MRSDSIALHTICFGLICLAPDTPTLGMAIASAFISTLVMTGSHG